MYDTSGTLFKAVINGKTGNELIRAFALWCKAGGEILTGLLNRRLSEANMYLNGMYSTSVPSNYNYVLYNANGGTASVSSQGYSSEWEVTPYPSATRSGYEFNGWYTAIIGGERVTKLTDIHDKKTLYAQWTDKNGEPPQLNEGEVVVTVTADYVNVRSGPGTDHSVVGMVMEGNSMIITETAVGGSYTWGKFENGWLALCYTNYDSVVAEKPKETTPPTETTKPVEPTEPETTVPPTTAPTEPTVPETTVPPQTEPETTVPTEPEVPETTVSPTTEPTTPEVPSEPTEPENTTTPTTPSEPEQPDVTEPVAPTEPSKPTTPEVTEPEETEPSAPEETMPPTTEPVEPPQEEPDEKPNESNKIYGTVSCLLLRVRSSASLSSSTVGYLTSGNRVEITDTKKNDGYTWGRISSGWIALEYVKLDSDNNSDTSNDNSSSGSDSSSSSSVIGIVNVSSYDYLNVRNSPSTSGSIVGKLQKNDRIEILEQKDADGITWGRFDNGWVSMQYIVLASDNQGGLDDDYSQPETPSVPETDTTPALPEDEVSTPNESTSSVFGTISASDSLYIRSSAGFGGSIVGYYPYNHNVEIFEQIEVDGMKWGRTNKGWISMSYVNLGSSSSSSTQSEAKTIIADCLRIRSGAGTNNSVVGYLYYGTSVQIFETETVDGVEWGRINNGWISMDYVK